MPGAAWWFHTRLLLVFGFCIASTCQKELRLFLHDMVAVSDGEYLNTTFDRKCKVNTRENPCDYATGMTITLLKTIQKPFIQFIIRDLSQDKVIVDQVILLCNLRGVNGLNILMKIMWEEMLKHMNFMFACPFKPRQYVIEPYRLDAMGLLFSIIPKNKPYQQTIFVKMRVGKKIENIFRYDGKIEVIEVD